MLTGILRYRSATRRPRVVAKPTSNDLLAHLLQSRSLRPYVFARHYDIGPFVVEHVCLERSVVVQLEPRIGADEARQEARRWLLHELGYSVLTIKRYDLTARPMQVIEQVRAILKMRN